MTAKLHRCCPRLSWTSAQPFPFLRNQEIYAAAVLKKPSKKKERVGIVACSSSALPRLVQVSERPKTYMLSEELILHFISKIFSNYEIKAKSLLRVSRNADIDADALYDEDLDYREFMSGLMKKRRRLAPIRLEMSRDLDKRIVKLLCKHLETEEYAVFKNNTPLDLSYLFMLQNTLRGNSELFYPHRSPASARKHTAADSGAGSGARERQAALISV